MQIQMWIKKNNNQILTLENKKPPALLKTIFLNSLYLDWDSK